MNEQSSVEKDELPIGLEKMESVSPNSPAENEIAKLKKKKKKKDDLSNKFSEKGSIRGVETMFKSSYTTQLALTTLADNKANIMISINGLILSIVIASSGTSINSSPYLLIPVGILLVSSLIAIFLAIRAARPNIYNAKPPTKEDFFTGKANALFFGHFATLSTKDYFEVVSTIMENRKLTYRLLTQHTHGLGIGLVRKFKLLQWSYTVFISGLSISIILFVIVYSSLHKDFFVKSVKATEQVTASIVTKPLEHTVVSVTKPNEPVKLPVFAEFRTLDSVHESSGIQQLPDGRFLVINDEKDHAMDILTLDDQGQFTVEPLFPDKLFEKGGPHSDFRKLVDLEGIDSDNQGYIYAVTSHSYNSKGEKKPDRKKLVRFKVEGNQIIDPIVISNLEESIAKQHPFLAKAIAETDSKSDQGFNIEGLSLNSTQDKLLFGLRTPLIDNKTVIVSLNNPKELFTTPNTNPQISDTVSLLDLGGYGVRSLNYFPLLNGYLIMSGPVGKSDNVNFKLWLWCGDTDAVQPVTVTGLAGFEETEGMAPMLWHEQPRIIMITDGALVGESTAARYIILKYEQLNIKNSCVKH